MYTACLEYACPPSPIPPFLLMQNLPSKQIAPNDNMRPKSDEAKGIIGGKSKCKAETCEMLCAQIDCSLTMLAFAIQIRAS